MGSIYEPPARHVLNVVNDFQPEITLSTPKPAKPGHFNSLYEWWNTQDLTQSMKIKSGLVCQELMVALVAAAPVKPTTIVADEMIKIAGIKKSKEADLIFSINDVNAEREIIAYREVKTNMNLDSEKMPASIEKIEQIAAALRRHNPDAIVDGKFLCPTRLESDGMIEGLNDFLVLLGYSPLSVKEFERVGAVMGEKMRALLDG